MGLLLCFSNLFIYLKNSKVWRVSLYNHLFMKMLLISISAARPFWDDNNLLRSFPQTNIAHVKGIITDYSNSLRQSLDSRLNPWLSPSRRSSIWNHTKLIGVFPSKRADWKDLSSFGEGRRIKPTVNQTLHMEKNRHRWKGDGAEMFCL